MGNAVFRTLSGVLNRRPDRTIPAVESGWGLADTPAKMGSHRDILTTGEVAKICNVAPRTVAKWFDRGELRGYRIPGSKDRRIPAAHLLSFLRAHDMPLDGLETGLQRILILDSDTSWSQALCDGLSRDDAYDVQTSSTSFEAGARLCIFKPHVLVVDINTPDIQPQTLGHLARTLEQMQGVRLIAVAAEMTDAQGQGLLQAGFHAYLTKPFEIRTLTSKIDELL